MSSKQDCCDACEREPRCAKFVFEHYGDDCQLFGPQSEKYYTFNLLSGFVEGRASSEDGHSVSSDAVGNLPDHGPDDTSWLDMAGPPVPPMHVFETLEGKPPPPPKADESGMATDVLADFSLFMGFLMLIVFALFAYLFFAQDIDSFLYNTSGGRLGKNPHSIMDRLENAAIVTEKPSALESKKSKKNALPEGWAKVTVQTSQVTQKKGVEVNGCKTIDELQQIIWDDFGHVLKKKKVKDMILLVWVGYGDAEASMARWELLNGASDMQRATACSAMMLTEKSAFDISRLTIAFTTVPTDESSKTSKKEVRRAPMRKETNDEVDSAASDDYSPGPQGNRRASGFARIRGVTREGGFRRIADAGSEEESGDDCGEPLCGDALMPKPKALKNGRKAGRNAKEEARSKQSARPMSCRRSPKDSPAQAQHKHKGMLTRKRNPAAAESDIDLEMAVPTSSNELLGKRAQLHGHNRRADFNWRAGTAASLDRTKGGSCVHLDTLDGEA